MKRFLLRTLRILALSAVGLYLVICAFMWWIQRDLIFFPERSVFSNPKKAAGLDYEDVKLTTRDGLHLDAWLVPHADAIATILYCHGNGGNIANVGWEVGSFHEHRFSSLAFDYRGYGVSDGTTPPTEGQSYLDGDAAWQFLVNDRHFDPRHIVIWGHSLGGGICTGIAERHRPGALVLESTFTSLPDRGAEDYPWLPVHLLARWRYPTKRRLASIGCPVAIAHSKIDEIIPYHHGRELFDAAREPKTFIELTGAHNDGLDPTPDAWPKLLAFLGSNGVLSR